jgi:hypothetical protein
VHLRVQILGRRLRRTGRIITDLALPVQSHLGELGGAPGSLSFNPDRAADREGANGQKGGSGCEGSPCRTDGAAAGIGPPWYESAERREGEGVVWRRALPG